MLHFLGLLFFQKSDLIVDKNIIFILDKKIIFIFVFAGLYKVFLLSAEACFSFQLALALFKMEFDFLWNKF